MRSIDQLRQERLAKAKNYRQQGINPYPAFYCKKTAIAQARNLLGQQTTLAGRIFTLRGHGKLIFADLKDDSGKIQLMFKADLLGDNFLQVKLLDLGDFILTTGKIVTTISGEITQQVEKIILLTKSIRPLPEKWHGLKDKEERYRQRYVDLLVNENIKKIFLTRTKIIRLLRQFLDEQDFLEVETPILQQIYGGASAKPFITHHNALNNDFYLRISDELFLKRLIVAGFEKVYEIGKDFRNEGIDKAHNPEFTMLEFYWAYVDYQYLMQFTEAMLTFIIQKINHSLIIKYKNKEYNFQPPWPKISYRELILKYLNFDIDLINTEKKLTQLVTEKKWLLEENIVGFGQTLDLLYKKYIRPLINGPLFLIDHPIEMKPLAKRKDDDPTKAASFQLLVAGEEWINAYNELNDPVDQKHRWEIDMELGKKGAEDYQVMDEDFIRALEYGMPPTAGWGLGIDRFVAFLTNQPTLKDVILFPTLRPENSSAVVNFSKQSPIKLAHPQLIMTREKALAILNKNTSNQNLIRHALATEASMKALAHHFQENVDLWGLVGLLHDADWEKTKDAPYNHGLLTVSWLKNAGETNPQLLHAILAHNFTHNKTAPPSSPLEWSIYCCDELTGLIVAVALILKSKKLTDVTAESVIKKFPSKSFAAGVKREQIKLCETKLGIKLEDFIQITLNAMQKIAPQLGL
jgi:lysyl-tRNA synthetase class 2